MGTDWYKANSMHKLSLNNVIETMSDDMRELFDEIYALSRQGKFFIKVKSISEEDMYLLKALGYVVNTNYIDKDYLGSVDGVPFYDTEEEYTIAWD